MLAYTASELARRGRPLRCRAVAGLHGRRDRTRAGGDRGRVAAQPGPRRDAVAGVRGDSAGFYIDYRVVDKDTMFLPAYLVWALWVGVGLPVAGRLVRPADASPRPRSCRASVRVLQAIMAGAVVFAVSLELAAGRPVRRLEHPRSGARRSSSSRGRTPSSSGGGTRCRWWSTCSWSKGGDRMFRPINRFLIRPDDLRELIEREVDRRPVYLDEPPGGCRPPCGQPW